MQPNRKTVLDLTSSDPAEHERWDAVSKQRHVIVVKHADDVSHMTQEDWSPDTGSIAVVIAFIVAVFSCTFVMSVIGGLP